MVRTCLRSDARQQSCKKVDELEGCDVIHIPSTRCCIDSSHGHLVKRLDMNQLEIQERRHRQTSRAILPPVYMPRVGKDEDKLAELHSHQRSLYCIAGHHQCLGVVSFCQSSLRRESLSSLTIFPIDSWLSLNIGETVSKIATLDHFHGLLWV